MINLLYVSVCIFRENQTVELYAVSDYLMNWRLNVCI